MTNDKPTILNDTVSQVNTDGAILQAEINANALETTYHFEYGPEPCSISACTSSPTGMLFDNLVPKPVSFQRSGLTPGETVYFRVVAQNSRGTVTGEDRQFTTYVPTRASTSATTRRSASRRRPRCCSTAAPTSWSRRPTPAAMTSSRTWSRASSRCRLPGRAGPGPLLAAPGLDPRHRRQPDQLRPRPVRRDPRPRRLDHHATSACPANGMTPGRGRSARRCSGADSPARASSPSAAKNICDPCFADGSTNIPLRLADGSLVKGMAGSLEPGRRPDPAGREGALRRRHAPRLRLDAEIRARRQRGGDVRSTTAT